MHLKGTEPHKSFKLSRRLFFIVRYILLSLLLILSIQQSMLNHKVMDLIPFLESLIVLHNHFVLDLSLFGQIVISKLKVSDIFLCVLVVICLELLPQTVVPLDSGCGDGLVWYGCYWGLVGKVVNFLKRIVHRILPNVSS
jgi:hypothetical protein